MVERLTDPPPFDAAVLIRTDFSDDAAWNSLVSYLSTERFVLDVGDLMACPPHWVAVHRTGCGHGGNCATLATKRLTPLRPWRDLRSS